MYLFEQLITTNYAIYIRDLRCSRPWIFRLRSLTVFRKILMPPDPGNHNLYIIYFLLRIQFTWDNRPNH